ncbi:MAG TPA: tRNA preQ1(34) S-adenosylmethionine ribosyltransferase-isomerase QueA [Candidatus Limnocylindrales bacterium]|nr:tRNA preQ1(34) S-adenosylmethionine ribosyltransferase-isomerase QueA [Candidatus Limnocylindrales bacterium]
MHLSDFDYYLPAESIAQHPADPRDSSRLLVLDRASGSIEHRIFRDLLDYVKAGDVLVLNNTRVIPARLRGVKVPTGGAVEVLLLRQMDETTWRALVGGRGLRSGQRLGFAHEVSAEIVEELEDAERLIRFSQPIHVLLDDLGEVPLPPYITEPLDDAERYQTVYSRAEGSSAAPTAGLHFTPELLMALSERGVQFAYVTLHIGLGTFQPVRVEDVTTHPMHEEYAVLKADDARIINDAKLAGGRIIAVGTTATRTLETAAILSEGGDPDYPARSPDACPWRPVTAFARDTRLFIYPGYRWRVVDGMITNFHLPRTTLLMMIASFAGRERVLQAYENARDDGYRFYSFGDAMLIL